MTNRRTGLARVGLSAIIAGLLLAIFGLTSPASAASVEPTPSTDDNPTCVQLNPAWVNEFKIDATPTNGDYPVSAEDSGVPGGGTVTISNAGVVADIYEFDWSSTIAWDAVIVKQGDGAQYYDYSPGSFGDTDLTPSTSNGQPTGGISHVTFCRDGVNPPDEECEPGQFGTFPDCQDPCVYDETIPADDPACGVCEEGQTGDFPNCVDPEADLAAAVVCGVPDGMKVTVTNTGDADGTVDITSDDVVVHDDVLVQAGQSVERIVDVEEDTAYDIDVVGVQSFTGTRNCEDVQGVVIPKTPTKPATQVAGVQVQQLPRTGDDELTLAMIGLGLVLLGAGALLVSRDHATI